MFDDHETPCHFDGIFESERYLSADKAVPGRFHYMGLNRLSISPSSIVAYDASGCCNGPPMFTPMFVAFTSECADFDGRKMSFWIWMGSIRILLSTYTSTHYFSSRCSVRQAKALVTSQRRLLRSALVNVCAFFLCVVRTGLKYLAFNLSPLIAGYTYTGPTVDQQNSCRCSSVYYSLLSGCAYCQGRNYRRWILFQAISFIVSWLNTPAFT